METVVLAPKGDQLLNTGLSAEVAETIINSIAPAMRESFFLKWRVFNSWCRQHRLDPVNCTVASVLVFLQNCFYVGLYPSIFKVSIVIIAAIQPPLGDGSLERHHLITHATVRPRNWPWFFEGSSLAPNEPTENLLTFKMPFLLAITFPKRVEDLQALSVTLPAQNLPQVGSKQFYTVDLDTCLRYH